MALNIDSVYPSLDFQNLRYLKTQFYFGLMIQVNRIQRSSNFDQKSYLD